METENANRYRDVSAARRHARRPLTRRRFIVEAAALGFSGSLYGQTTTPAEPLQPDSAALRRVKREGSTLYIYNWEDYFHPDTIPEFEQLYRTKVVYDAYPGNEHMLAKLQTGGVSYDVIFPTHSFIPILVAQNLLSPLRRHYLPNRANIMPRFLDTHFDPGNKYSLPYTWGMTAIGYNSKYVKEDPNLGSWALIFDSGPQRYSGKIGFTDEREEVIAAALKYKGFSANTHKESELREAGKILVNIKPHLKAFYPGTDEKKAFITEDIVVGHSWNGEVVKAGEKNNAVKWSLPKEGGTGWYDAMVIGRQAPHKFTAHAFMNFLMRPDIAAKNSAAVGYATPNQTALQTIVAPEIAANPAVYPTAKDMKKIEFLATIPDHILPVYSDIWTRLLS